MAHDRRRLLFTAATALLLPTLGAWPRTARAHGKTFTPPHGPMLYTRRLERSLPGDAHFKVSRSFMIRFQEAAGGYRVDGEQVAVEVDAPDSLAPFAEIERQRRELALFPLLLDLHGLIAPSTEAADPPRLDQAVQEVLSRIARLPVPGADKEELTRFVRAVHANAADLLTELPRDLFAPDGQHGSQTRTLPLPGGEGLVTVTYTAETEPATGLLRSARREVVTEFGGSLRRTLESWTLVPQA